MGGNLLITLEKLSRNCVRFARFLLNCYNKE